MHGDDDPDDRTALQDELSESLPIGEERDSSTDAGFKSINWLFPQRLPSNWEWMRQEIPRCLKYTARRLQDSSRAQDVMAVALRRFFGSSFDAKPLDEQKKLLWRIVQNLIKDMWRHERSMNKYFEDSVVVNTDGEAVYERVDSEDGTMQETYAHSSNQHEHRKGYSAPVVGIHLKAIAHEVNKELGESGLIVLSVWYGLALESIEGGDDVPAVSEYLFTKRLRTEFPESDPATDPKVLAKIKLAIHDIFIRHGVDPGIRITRPRRT
jgi:hypothetical protein